MNLLDATYGWALAVLPYLGIVLFILVAAFYGGIETGAYRLNRLRLWLRAEQGDRSAQTIQHLVADMRGFICITLIGHNLGVYAVTTITTGLCLGVLEQEVSAELMATLLLAPILFIFAEVTPKNLFTIEADRWMYRVAPIIKASSVIFRATGLTAILRATGSLWLRVMRQRGPGVGLREPRQRLRAFLRECGAAGVLTEYQEELSENVLNLKQVTLKEVMIPLSGVHGVPADSGREDFVRLIRGHNYSHVPVSEGMPANIIGILNVYDALGTDVEQFNIRRLMQPVLQLPQDLSVNQALLEMQKQEVAMAVVVDPKGPAVGIVTIKDLVEEIVGELAEW